MKDRILKAELVEEKAIIWDREGSKQLFETGWYGEFSENRLELALVEAALLLERQKIEIVKNKKKIL